MKYETERDQEVQDVKYHPKSSLLYLLPLSNRQYIVKDIDIINCILDNFTILKTISCLLHR